MDIREIVVIGITPDNWQEVMRVFEHHGIRAYTKIDPTYLAHVERSTYPDRINGWGNASYAGGSMANQVALARRQLPNYSRITVAKFIETFGQPM